MKHMKLHPKSIKLSLYWELLVVKAKSGSLLIVSLYQIVNISWKLEKRSKVEE